MMSRLFGARIVDQLPALQRYARALTHDEAEANDLVHDALLLACEKHRTFRTGGNLRSWLLSIVHNSFVDGKRRDASQRRRVERAASDAIEHAAGSQESAARLTAVAQAFERLPDDQRAVLHLVAIEGLSYGEAAEALGVPAGTIMSRLSRARAALRESERLPRPTRALRAVGGNDDR